MRRPTRAPPPGAGASTLARRCRRQLSQSPQALAQDALLRRQKPRHRQGGHPVGLAPFATCVVHAAASRAGIGTSRDSGALSDNELLSQSDYINIIEIKKSESN